MTRWIMVVVVAMGLAGTAMGEAKPAVKPAAGATTKKAAPSIRPMMADVAYGGHPKQVVDFYRAKSEGPAPLVLFIHGGGWMNGSKASIAGVAECLKAGISVVSVEYRFVSDAQKEGIKPPVKWPLEDAARALQFVRSKAGEWNIDKKRIGACGGSAGACSSLWLAFHDEMADVTSADPVARESTRLYCAAVIVAQTSLDPKQMKEWTPNSRYGAHAFGLKSFSEFLESREKIMPWIKAYSPYELVSADDPAVYLFYSTPPALGQDQKDPTHTANFGVKLQEKILSVGGKCELMYPGAPDAKHKTAAEYLIAKLKE